jgi:hypothetical protein
MRGALIRLFRTQVEPVWEDWGKTRSFTGYEAGMGGSVAFARLVVVIRNELKSVLYYFNAREGKELVFQKRIPDFLQRIRRRGR